MHVLLIRHGETVDNVAGLYAGSRDSALTNHGVIQADRLGEHIRKRRGAIGPVRYLFASDLQRAYKTAQAIADAQHEAEDDEEEAEVTRLHVQRVSEIREKDFGSSEGKKFGTRAAEETIDAETPEAIRARLSRFIDDHLDTIFRNHASEHVTVAVVSHGIVLNALLRVLKTRYPEKRYSETESAVSSEYHVQWTNTGVLQAKLVSAESNAMPTLGSTDPSDATSVRLRFLVQSTNDTEHLKGLRKTRGGIGSAKFDKRQRTMDSFFGSTSRKAS